MPTAEELDTVKNYFDADPKADANLLENTSKFFHTMSSIHSTNLKLRLEQWLFKCQFEEKIGEVEVEVKKVAAAVGT
jgi:hypothetical protein